MTNERAVEILNLDLDILGQYGGETAEAYKMAIKALEAQPCEDCISRQAVIDFIIDNYGVGFNSLTNGIRDYLPSVTPQTVTEFADKCKECGKIQNKFFNFDAPMVKNSDAVSREAVIRLVEQYPNIIGNRCSGLISDIKHLPSVTPRRDLAETSQDCISRQAVRKILVEAKEYGSWDDSSQINRQDALDYVDMLPSVTPKYTDEEIDKIQEIEQAYVDKMVELAVEEAKRPKGKWINKFGKEQGYDIAGIKTWYIQIICDKCGFIKTAIEGHTGQYHYCPNCGAEMEVKE